MNVTISFDPSMPDDLDRADRVVAVFKYGTGPAKIAAPTGVAPVVVDMSGRTGTNGDAANIPVEPAKRRGRPAKAPRAAAATEPPPAMVDEATSTLADGTPTLGEVAEAAGADVEAAPAHTPAPAPAPAAKQIDLNGDAGRVTLRDTIQGWMKREGKALEDAARILQEMGGWANISSIPEAKRLDVYRKFSA